jgi:hypothetical protein
VCYVLCVVMCVQMTGSILVWNVGSALSAAPDTLEPLCPFFFARKSRDVM